MAEDQFVADGFGIKRINVMYNNFIIVGPQSDPAHIHGIKDVPTALSKIAKKQAFFTSRGDNSGTHMKEIDFWKSTIINPLDFSGKWYLETGSGMGKTLNVGTTIGAYMLVDKSSWIAFANKQSSRIYIERGTALKNQYSIILVNPRKHPHVKARDGQIFINWITGPAGQKAIANYRLNGQQLFFPNANQKN